jgi:hypothetical protein
MIKRFFDKTELKVYVDYYFRENNIDVARQLGYFDFKNNWQKVSTNPDLESVFNDVTLESLNIEDLDFYTPPTLSTYRVAIPAYWEMLFPNDRFIVGGFDIPLERTTDNVLCVDVAYLEWKAFREELLNPENSVLARHMGAVMVHLDKRHENKDYV